MARALFGTFIFLHGLIHLLYAGHSFRILELQTGMRWPDESWLLSQLSKTTFTRWMAGLASVIAALTFVLSSAGLFFRQTWWRPLIVGGALFSSLLYLIFWNGNREHLDNQGAFALLINAALLSAVLILNWPAIYV